MPAQMLLARFPVSRLSGAGGAGGQPSGGAPRLLPSLQLGLWCRSLRLDMVVACLTTPLLLLDKGAKKGRRPTMLVVSTLRARPSLRLRTGALVPLLGARASVLLLGARVPLVRRRPRRSAVTTTTKQGRWVLWKGGEGIIYMVYLL